MKIVENQSVVAFVLACDEKQATGLCFTIASVAHHNASHFDFLDFFVYDNGLAQKTKKEVKKLVGKYPNIKVTYLEAKTQLDEFKELFEAEQAAWTVTALARYFIPYDLKKLDTCIYIDCDFLVRNSFKKMLNMLGENDLAVVVQDQNIVTCDNFPIMEHLDGEKSNRAYFNSGLIVMNLKLMRDMDLTRACLNLQRRQKDIGFFADQDVLNSLCRDRLKFADAKWNKFAWLFERPVNAVGLNTNVHYVGGKPWVHLRLRFPDMLWHGYNLFLYRVYRPYTSWSFYKLSIKKMPGEVSFLIRRMLGKRDA